MTIQKSKYHDDDDDDDDGGGGGSVVVVVMMMMMMMMMSFEYSLHHAWIVSRCTAPCMIQIWMIIMCTRCM